MSFSFEEEKIEMLCDREEKIKNELFNIFLNAFNSFDNKYGKNLYFFVENIAIQIKNKYIIVNYNSDLILLKTCGEEPEYYITNGFYSYFRGMSTDYETFCSNK